jgi:hypothetical protein
VTAPSFIRYAFIPADYREPVVLGWRLAGGTFVGDESHGTEGFLVRVKLSDETPTIPPAPEEKKQ